MRAVIEKKIALIMHEMFVNCGLCKRPLTLAGFASACHGPLAYLNSAIRLMKIDCTATSA